MKTVKIYSIILFAMFFISLNAGFAKKSGDRGSNMNPSVSVRYQVTVHLAADKPLCNVYQIEILNANGMQVAPSQIFIPGTSVYTFYEQTRQSNGLRIARLVQVPFGKHYVCETELFAVPDVNIIEFKDAGTYLFNLYPTSKPSKKIE
jgi:hypothetical protein